MKYWMLALVSLGLMIPLACNSLVPTGVSGSGSGYGVRSDPTPTATNLNGWTSTPTATLQPTPAYISTTSSGITSPNGIAYSSPYIYVADGDGSAVSQVQVLNAGNNTVNWTWNGSGSTLFQWPNGVAVNSAGTTVYVLDVNATSGNGTIYALAPAATPTPLTAWNSYNGKTLSWPGGIALDSTGNVYVADTNNGLLEESGPAGAAVASWSSRDVYPAAVAVEAGNVYVADISNKLWVLTASGSSFTVATSWSLPYAPWEYAFYGLTADANNVYVADYYNDQVEVYKNTGSLIGVFNGNQTGATPLDGPDGLLLYNNDIYVAGNDNNIIEIFGPNNY